MVPPQEIPEGAVVITPAEVYNKVVTLTEAVTQLLERDKVDRQHMDNLTLEVRELKSEVSSLKVKVYVIAATFATLGAAAGSAVSPFVGA